MTERSRRERRTRQGILKVEALIAAVILVAAMNFVSMTVHRINRIWEQTRQYQFAINELSNQLESLIALPPEEAKEKLATLKPSSNCEDVLGSPRFETSVGEDELGTRITLSLAWQDVQPHAPQLTAWLVGAKGREE